MSAVLTALSVYDDLAKIAGAGTLVPITGFANAVVSPAIEFKAEGFVTGMAAKMFIIAGPVIVYGTVASVLYGVILVISAVRLPFGRKIGYNQVVIRFLSNSGGSGTLLRPTGCSDFWGIYGECEDSCPF